jgi:hypothetical protein
LQAISKTLQIIIRCKKDQRLVFVAGKEGQPEPLPVLFHRHPGHANAQNEGRIDELWPATALLLGNCGIEFGTKLAAMTIDVALGGSTASSMLPAFEAVGKPQKLEVVVPRHAESVFGQML